jgi:methyl-accepting chemotaxis protein
MSIAATPLAMGFGLAVFALAYSAAELLIISPAANNARLACAMGRPLQRVRRGLTARVVLVIVASTLSPGLVVFGELCIRAILDSELPNGHIPELTVGAGLLLLGLLCSSACGVLVARTILSSVANLIGTVRHVADQADGPLTTEVQSPFNDELSDLSESVSGAFENLSRLTQAASTIASGDLGVEILGQGQLPDALRAMSTRVRTLVEETSATSSELASAAVEISAAAQELEIASSSQASGMIEISQTMDSLLRSASHISDAVQGVAQNAERTLQNTEQMVTRIDLLSTHANRIGDILEVIREIANQSDLLALNGSLEATRVGEAGRGFALVAGEMRRLAERVTASVHDVKKLVADIRESGASTVVATEESKKLAEATAGAARSITLATQQQRSSTEQVNQSVQALSEIVEQAALATTQTRTSAEGLRVFADRLNQVVGGFNVTRLAR